MGLYLWLLSEIEILYLWLHPSQMKSTHGWLGFHSSQIKCQFLALRDTHRVQIRWFKEIRIITPYEISDFEALGPVSSFGCTKVLVHLSTETLGPI